MAEIISSFEKSLGASTLFVTVKPKSSASDFVTLTYVSLPSICVLKQYISSVSATSSIDVLSFNEKIFLILSCALETETASVLSDTDFSSPSEKGPS